MNDQTTRDDQALEQELSQLKQEHDRLKMEKVRVEENLANLKQNLDQLEQQAQEEYGTSDPAQLQKMLEERRAENRALVDGYRAHIGAIREGLNKVESGNGQ